MREAIEFKGKGNTKLYREDYSESVWEDILRFEFGISDKEILEYAEEITVPFSNFIVEVRGEFES